MSIGATTGVVEGAAASSSVAGTMVEMTGKRNSKAYETLSSAKIDEQQLSGKYQSIGAAQYNGQMKNFGERPWHSVEVWWNFVKIDKTIL